MKYIDLINYSNNKLESKKLEKNVGFKLLFFIDKNIQDINEFVENRNKKISLYKTLLFKYYLFQYIKLNKPLQYITKQAFFYNYEFIIYKNVHSPKYESQMIVKKAIELIGDDQNKKVLDICCGTGALGISILLEKNISLTLSDIDKKAIKNTYMNLEKYNLHANVIKSNLFEKIEDKFDLIVCNPPYISYDDKSIDASVKKYESKKSLFAKDNGLFFYNEIINNVKNKLEKDGVIIFEVGYKQSDDVIKIFKNINYVKNIETLKDDLGYVRLVVVYF